MDGQRFDSLARAVAGSGSRRGLLRGLAGVVALLALDRRPPSAAAQSGVLGPGDACYDDSQCSPSVMNYSPLVCADNGFAYDGPLNCCTGEGGFCFSDEGCCGVATCGFDARCASTPSSAPPYAPSYAGLGDPCQTNDECFAGGLVCDYVGQTDDFRCCTYEGGPCGWDGQCCGWLTCGGGGYCGYGDPAPSDGLPLGVQCSYAAQCSGGGYGVDCADNGGFVPACCLIGGQACSADLDCCMPNNCIGGYCGSAVPYGCSGYWCDCNPNDPYACDPGLSCCAVQSGYVCAGAEQCGFMPCTGQGCPCIDGVLGNCDYGLECCVQGDPGAGGICGPIGNCYSSLAGACTGVWCDCAVHDPYACDAGLICCGPGEADARGTCQRRQDC